MKRKGYIAESDVAQLLKRYDSSTILSLLYEISRYTSNAASAKLNWEVLVKDSNTGIKSPREYQALWRHLAYRMDLDPPEADDLPLEDDDGSDFEFELEPFPSVPAEAAAEAANYVKTLMGSSLDIASTNAEVAERKKRRLWSSQEDEELTGAVEKYGEGNWAIIFKNFRHDRSAAQLAQRWALIKKRGTPSTPTPSPSTPPDPELVATAKKFELLVPKFETKSSTKPGTEIRKPVQPPPPPRLNLSTMTAPKASTSKVPASPAPTPAPQPRTSGPDPMVQAAAVAAGARIAPAYAAASLLKHSKNLMQMRQTTSTMVSPSVPSKASPSVTTPKPSPSIPTPKPSPSVPTPKPSPSVPTPKPSPSIPSSKPSPTTKLSPTVTATRTLLNLAGTKPSPSFTSSKPSPSVKPLPSFTSSKPAPSVPSTKVSPSITACVSNTTSSNAKPSPSVVHYIRTGSGPTPAPMSLSKRPLKPVPPAGNYGKGCTLSKMAAVGSNVSSTSTSGNPRLAIRNKDGTIQEITETKPVKKKVIVARESNGLVRVNSWYEGDEFPGETPKTVVDIDSEDNEDFVTVGASSRSPLSQSSGQSD